MIDDVAMQLAMRARALTLSVATTGAVSLSATSTGYARATGSFYTDNLWPGMEFVASGFTNAANNGTGVITAVAPTSISASMFTIAGQVVTFRTNVAEVAAVGRTLAAGLPSLRAWENVTLVPVTNLPFVEEQYIPGPTKLLPLGQFGWIDVRPMYSLLINVPSDTGLTAHRYADAVVRLFPPSLAIALANGDVLHVRGDQAPFKGQLQQSQPGFAVKPLTIPFYLRTQNTV